MKKRLKKMLPILLLLFPGLQLSAQTILDSIVNTQKLNPGFNEKVTELPDSTYSRRSFDFCCVVVKPDSILAKEIEKEKVEIFNFIDTVFRVGSSKEDLMRIIPRLAAKVEDRDQTLNLNYNLELAEYEVHGFYSSLRLYILFCGKDVLKIYSILDFPCYLLPSYKNYLEASFQCMEGVVFREQVFEKNLNNYEKRYAKLFLYNDKSSLMRGKAFSFFTSLDDRRRSMNGKLIESNPEWGLLAFNNIRYFIANKDWNGLENILYCPIPSSRLIAARALLYVEKKFGYKTNDNNRHRIKEILNGPKIVGCGSARHSGMSIFEFDIENKFEYYLKAL